jgi:hypothetical protein
MAGLEDRRALDHNRPASWRPISRRDAGRTVAAAAILAGLETVGRSGAQEVKPAGGVGFTGESSSLRAAIRSTER